MHLNWTDFNHCKKQRLAFLWGEDAPFVIDEINVKHKWATKSLRDRMYKRGKRINAYYLSVASPFDTNDGHSMNKGSKMLLTNHPLLFYIILNWGNNLLFFCANFLVHHFDKRSDVFNHIIVKTYHWNC